MTDPLDTTLPPRAHRFVACLDVLGFKKFVEDNTLDEVVRTYERLIALTIENTQFPVVKAYSASGVRTDIEQVPFAIGSDSIFLWQTGSGGEHAQNFFDAAGFLVAASVDLGVPLRGGIAFGECLMDKSRSMYIGQPIVDAHVVETKQEWAGVGIHPSTFDSPLAHKSQIADLVEYTVPTKPGCQLTHALRWHAYASPNVEARLTELAERLEPESTPRRKLENTIAFCHSVPRDA